MGLLIEGRWHDQWYDTKKSGGRFVRTEAQFRDRVTADGMVLHFADASGAERALAPVSAAPARTLAVLRALPFMREASNSLALTEWALETIDPIDEA